METQINEVEVNGKKYVLKDLVGDKEIVGETKIVVLQRGWIVVGKFVRNGNDCELHNASVVRTWGTSNGLGEIAKKGPTTSTKLDKCHGVVKFDYLTVCFTLDCEESKWKSAL